ncbi:MAG: beta-ketoacyl synthase N-terminal-like domain-containing protein, partial [Promethearchaeota archaeon]
MLKKEEIKKILSNNYPIFGYMPKGFTDPQFAINLSQNGAIGLIDFEGFDADQKLKCLQTMNSKLKSSELWGIRVISKNIFANLPENVHIPLLIVGYHPNKQEIKEMRSFSTIIISEVLYLEEAQENTDWADFFLVKGNEAGGLVGTKNTFIQMQEFEKAGLSYIIQGGFGVFNVASALIGGALGIVFESQLYLLQESPLSKNFKDYIKTLEENDFFIASENSGLNFRLTGKLANKTIRNIKKNQDPVFKKRMEWKEKEEFRNKIYSLAGFGHEKQSLPQFFADEAPKHAWLPTDQGICFAKYIADQFIDIPRFLKGINILTQKQISIISVNWPFEKDSKFAQSLNIKYPIVQGPMANISDNVEFAIEVAKKGALPVFAMGGLMGPQAEELLATASKKFPPELSFGCGIIGLEAVKKRRADHLISISKHHPAVTLVAAGTTDLGLQVKELGNKVLIHTPALSMFKDALKKGLEYPILEGNECGGHIGILSSFILWENVLEYLDINRTSFASNEEKIKLIFAGGINNAYSTGMIAAMIGNHLDIINPGLQIGSAYLLTQEITKTKALSQVYQELLLNHNSTRVIGATVNTRARLIPSNFANRTVEKELDRIQKSIPISERKNLFEKDNLGALQIASKAEIWNPKHVEGSGSTQFVPVETEKQIDMGCFMAGEDISVQSSIRSIADLHYDISIDAFTLVKNRGLEFLRELTLKNEEKSLIQEQFEEEITLKPKLISSSMVAIIGIGCIFPDANNVEEFWNNILSKKYSITEVPKERWDPEIYFDPDRSVPDKSYTKIGGFIKNFKFKSVKYRIPPKMAAQMDDVQKWALEAAKETLLDAGYPIDGKKRLPFGVIVGNALGGENQRHNNKRIIFNEIEYRIKNEHVFDGFSTKHKDQIIKNLKQSMLHGILEINEDTMPGELSNIISGRIANVFNLTGKNMTTDAACASSLAALDTAVKGLLTRDYDVVLTGGADRSMDPAPFIKFCKIGALSADESCPFDAKADGFVMGEGAGFVMLKRLDDAIRDKNKIYAIIKGIGASADGKGKGITAPNPKGQKEAFERAYKSAQIDPSKIQYVECHGTSTIAGDAAELTILNEIFAKNKRKSPLAVGSVKSQIGHLKSAAGIASIIKTSLALSHKILPPSINFNIPNPKIDWSKAPFYVNKDPIPWEVSENYPRRAGISAFGFGGTNYHVVMEEYKPGNYYMNSQSNAGEVLTSQIGPHSQSQSTSASLDQDPRLSFLFSGQGSQYLGMGKELYKKIPTIKNILDQANSICKSFGKFNMLNILFGSPDLSLEENKSKIIQTQYTQPILYSLEVALFTYYQENNLIPGMVAGHSLGEFTALTCANVINFEDGLKAVILRGKAMANTSKGNAGTMAAIFTTGIVVEDMIQKLNNGYITISNYNSPSQTVISGEESAINQAIEVFTKAGITAKKINVSAAFHSRLVAHAQDAVKPFLEGIEFKTPEIPVYSNVSGKMYPSSPEKIKQLLIKQITSPVHWVEEISNMYQDGGRIFIEVGPKKTLFYFAKDILKSYKDTEISYSFSPKSQEVSQIEKIIKKYNKKTQPNTDIGKKTNLNISKKGQRFGTQGTAFSVLGETPILEDLSKEPHFEEYLRDQSEFLGTLLNQGFKQYQAKYQPALEKQKQIEKFDFNTEPIGITGVGIGLPGKNRNVFDDQNVIDVLHGINLIEPIDIDLQKETLKKNIVRLEKTADGNASFKPIDDISQVIHLAGQLGHFNPTEDFKLEPKYLNALDTTFQLAIGAGLEALKDAGIPLVRSQIKTSTGKILQGDWALPKELQEETGVIFASAFPGYNNLIEDITTHLTQEFKTESYQNIKRFYESLITSVSNEKSRKNLETWFEENKSQLFDEKIEVKEFNRAFLFRILAMGHSQFAQLIKAKGPNAYNNTACASTTQAIGMAGDWIRLGRCKRVIVIAADDVTDKRVLPWFAAGFISGGAGTTKEKWEEAVLPFGEGRNGLIMGSAASGLVIESETAYNHRGVKPIVDYLGSHFCNSAFHGSRLDRNHIPREVKKFINKMEKRYSISQDDLVTNGMFVSHETYTPARGGSAEAELDALTKVFGEDAYKMLIINTKGYTGHPMGAGIEEVVAIKSMETGIIPPIANYKHLDPEFSKFNFAMGKNERKKYAMRFAAGFGSQMAVVLLRLNTYTDRFANKEYDNWLNSINGTRNGLFKDGRILKIKTQKKLPKQLVQKPIVSKSIEVELKQIIANKTGYDIADIESEYDLEEDLGVDTVKQAEIFGEVREHWNLKENQNMNLADFRNVSDIVKMIDQHTGNFNITDPSKNQAMSQPISQNSVPIQSASASQSSVDEIKQIIANKTGYEIEDIENDFDLEEDLGIDTVKQTEIFGEIRERWSLQENDGTSLADFRTINDIVKSIGANHDHSLRQELLTVKSNNSTEFEIKQIVANKTGYEIEDIENDFDLEEDLGIDTVKQAEIFGEIRERWNLQENDGTSLADFRTINDILKTVQQNNGESLKAYSVENKSEITSNSEGNDSIEHVIKQVISEKTGYEKGDIENDFDLEEDLGVDTVKQVEIFGLLREKFHLKDSDNSGLANLRTLNQIADFIRNSQIQHSSKNDSKKEDENIETRKSSEIDNNSNKNVTQEENKDNISTSMVQPVKIQNLAFSDEKWQLKNNNILLIDLGSKLANEMKNKFQIQDLKPHLFKLEQISLKNENKFGSTVLILPDCELNTKSHSDAALIFDRLFKLFKEIDISSLENIVILSPEEYFGWESKANPISGAISGFIKTLGKEYGIPIKHIYGNYPEQIYQELSNWDDFEEIAFKNKNRYTLVKKEVNLSIPNTQNSKIDDISSDEILLATGGARGITFACLDNLTDKVQPTVVLLGRTNLSEKVEDLISLTSEDLVIKRD